MYFTIDRASGGYRVRIYGGNHEQVFISEVYFSKNSCWNAINMVKVGAPNALVYDRA